MVSRWKMGNYKIQLWMMAHLVLILLGVFTLLLGVGFVYLGGGYLLDAYGVIDAPNPRWIGWFVDDLTGLGMSARPTQAVVWAMLFLGVSSIAVSADYLRLKLRQMTT